MKLGIVGLGLIGSSVALGLKKANWVDTVWGYDVLEQHAKLALDLSIIDQIKPLEDIMAEMDLIVLAIPVQHIVNNLNTYLDLLADHAALTDMGSTKEPILKVIADHPKAGQFVGGHPMAGTENSGPAASLDNLFAHKVAILCPQATQLKWAQERVEAMYGALEMKLLYMDAVAHDMHAAYVSHISHISSFVLANTVLEKEQDEEAIFSLASGGFESTVRLAKSSAEMWTPIFIQNKDNLLEVIDTYMHKLSQFRAAIAKENEPKLLAMMREGNQIRKILK